MILVSMPPQPPGPEIRLVKALPRASQLPPWVIGGVKAILRDLPGAVVVIEDEAPRLPALPAQKTFLGGRLKYAAAGLPSPHALTPPVPPWMDPTVIRSGGNVVHKIYTFGGVSY